LAAVGHDRGFALLDLETGAELALVPLQDGVGGACFDADGALYTHGHSGLFRWPLDAAPDRPGKFTLGPPESLPFPRGDRSASASADGRVIAQATFGNGAWLLRRGARRPVQLGKDEPEKRYIYVSVSPDGRWVACGVHAVRVDVYEAATGRRVWQAP